MSRDAFRMEVLSKSINELQQEKARCEHKLRDMRNKRKALEKKCEAAVTKYNQVEEKQSKMLETVKIAQHKVNQSQSELDNQHSLNKQLQAKVEQVEGSIAGAEEQHRKNVELFDEKLSELVDNFHRSRHFYTNESLLKEIDLMKQKEKELEQDTIAVKTQTEKMNMEVSEMADTLQQKRQDQDESGISAANQREVLSMLMGENEASGRVLQDLRERSKAINADLEHLAQWKPPQDVTIEE